MLHSGASLSLQIIFARTDIWTKTPQVPRRKKKTEQKVSSILFANQFIAPLGKRWIKGKQVQNSSSATSATESRMFSLPLHGLPQRQTRNHRCLLEKVIRLFRTPLCSLNGILKLTEHSTMLSDLQLIPVSRVQLILTDLWKTDTPFSWHLILKRSIKKKTHWLWQDWYNSSGWFPKWLSIW